MLSPVVLATAFLLLLQLTPAQLYANFQTPVPPPLLLTEIATMRQMRARAVSREPALQPALASLALDAGDLYAGNSSWVDGGGPWAVLAARRLNRCMTKEEDANADWFGKPCTREGYIFNSF